MNRKEAYTNAMIESIRNAGMWLKEARLVAKRGSRSHAQALLILAGEETGKAVHCWFAIKGIMPFNHPDVDFRSEESVFRNHTLKNATAFGLLTGTLLRDSASEEDFDPVISDPETGRRMKLREMCSRVGLLASWARSTWMYVDIRKSKNRGLEVSSPMSREPASVEDGMDQFEEALRTLKTLIKETSSLPGFAEYLAKVRAFLEVNDERYPRTPEWE